MVNLCRNKLSFLTMENIQPEFPIKVTFDDGEIEFYNDVEDIELNLEDFDSEIDTDCSVEDRFGRTVSLRVKLLNLERFELDRKREA